MVQLKSFIVPLLSVASALSASLTQVSNFGSNPTGVQMFVYKPDRLASPPPVLVAIHYCTGTAQAYYSGTQYHTLADQYGFIVIYPDAPDPGGCWDVHTNATLTHNAGGDSLGIVSMVRYAISTWGADSNRVFVTGTSSGAMMTNVLLGAYPDVFKGGAAFSGVPYGCFAGSSMWNSQCAQGQLSKTPQQWGDQVRAGYPGFTGTRPKMQVWHGTTDTTLYPQNLWEEIKQWTNVLGYSQTPTQVQSNTPLSSYTKYTFGPNFVAYNATGVGHTVPERANDVLAFFGLNGAPPTSTPPTTTPPTTTPPTTTPPTTTPPTTTPPTGGSVPHWGQCGGIGWTGGTVCQSPYTCQKINDYYYQCL